MLISITGNFELSPMKEAANDSYAATLYYIVWTGLSALVMVNMFIAIITDASIATKRNIASADRIMEDYNRRQREWDDLNGHSKKDAAGYGDFKHALEEVDLDRLWSILNDSVEDGRATLEPADCAGLFGGNIMEARLFLDRICTMARFPLMDKRYLEVSTCEELDLLDLRMGGLQVAVDDARHVLATYLDTDEGKAIEFGH